MSKEVVMGRKGRGKGGSPALTEGARRATGGGAGGGSLAPGQRWNAGRKREVVLRLLRGESRWLGCLASLGWSVGIIKSSRAHGSC
jgi:hypothetical protein